ncbi:MAG: glycosyltransferase family 4 protein [Erythrobacter sp.]|nr:glycosyltransferase family 4 protein [Erythrobacter sp.]
MKDRASASVFSTWSDAGLSDAGDRQRVALIGTYAPRKCGIATFTTDLREKLAEFELEIDVDVYALADSASDIAYPETTATIDADDASAYRAVAARINASAVDVVWLQHEFGIFGGPDGDMVCDFVDRIAAPLIVTLHTVLSEPSEAQRRIIVHLTQRASRIMVMAEHSREMLATRYGVDRRRVVVIEHGAPERPQGREREYKARLGHADRKVMMTFGLLGPGKGLEHAIEALPAIAARHPQILYRIVGATHPNLVAQDGESYREHLQELVERLAMQDHVEWDDRFLETDELLDQLEGCDIYLTPYPNLQQSTSGTLSYAVALGKPVIATPYIHARELLADDVGCLVAPCDPDAITQAVVALLHDTEARAAMSRRAYRRGQKTVWPRFAEAAASLIRETAVSRRPTPFALRRPNPAAVHALSDGTGLLQHALGPVPDRRHGYCLDDNARALILMMRAERDERSNAAALTYASFVQHAWNEERGAFRNFMRFDRSWCEEEGADDANGRAIWALGDCCARSPDPALARWARRLYDDALPHMETIDSPRALAFLSLGALAVLETEADHGASRDLVTRACECLCSLLRQSRRPGLTWFEAVLAYDNPRLSQVLIQAGRIFERPDWLETGLDTLEWLAQYQYAADGHFRPVGSDSLGREDLPPLPFDQQPLEAQAAIEACAAAWRATGEDRWYDRARRAYDWFFGANDRGSVLADPVTGRCRDGLTPRGANENCGAESILAFHLAYHSMLALSRQATDEKGERISAGTNRAFGPSLAHP